MNEKNILQELRSANAQNPTTAVQGVRLEELKNRQLHPSREQLKQLENTDIQDFFFLITEVNDVTCKVISGSLDGVMAGPNDIVLPKNVLGQYVYLSMDMQTTVPKSALADGFAILDDECYQRIMASCKEFADGSVGEIPPYSRAMPYISDHDDRIEYHNKQKLLLEKIQMSYHCIAKEISFPEKKYSFPRLWECNTEALAAGDEEEDIQINCRIDERDEFVSITYSFSEETLWLNIFLPDQSGFSSQLDGMEVIDPDGNTLGVINSGQCQISGLKNFEGCIGIKNKDGYIWTFSTED